MHGEIRNAFRTKIVMETLPLASIPTALSHPDTFIVFRRNISSHIGDCVLGRKPANTTNKILVNQINSNISGSYSSLVLSHMSAGLSNSGVSELTV